jgi:pimeloyl-ACP methyl ester carboxylesterase
LLLHSLAAHGHWWDWTAPLLAGRFHVVALDFRGHGESQWAEPPAYRFDDHAGDVLAAMDALGWDAPVVIGHSMGGYVGAYLAALHPRRVDRLVVADVLTGWTVDLAARAERQAARVPARSASREEAGARFKLAPPETSAPAERLQHLGETGVVERAPGVWEPAFDRHVFLHPPVDPWPFLPAVTCPTLVVRGAGSSVMSGEDASRVARAVQRGHVEEVPGAYHHLVVDHPVGFVAVLDGWLGKQ